MTNPEPLSGAELEPLRWKIEAHSSAWIPLPRLLATIDAQQEQIATLTAQLATAREALRELSEWPNGGNRYGQTNMQKFARAALAATTEEKR